MPNDTAPELLYIEDDALTAERVGKVIQDAGYTITHAARADEALQAYRDHSFDIIAIDFVLPDMNGNDLIRRMKEYKPLPPTVVLTGFGDELTAVEVMRLGVIDYIPKDTDGRYLMLIPTVLKHALDQGRIEAEKRIVEKELDAFAHTVAHDLKNPLNSILGLANLVRENKELTPDEVDDSLMFIEQSAANMNSIIDSLMVLAGVRKQEIVLQELDMGDIVEHTRGRLTFFIHEMKAQIIVGDLPRAVGYAPWIQEVWVNYITNAIKYGGSPPIIHIGGETLEDGRAKFWVKDNGPGIAAEDQNRLFVPFSRLQQVSVKGYGLGLSIVLRIINRLGGEVGIESEAGSGSLFYFILSQGTEDSLKG